MIRRLSFLALTLLFVATFVATSASAQTVRITTPKPETIVFGTLPVAVTTADPVTHVTLFVNGVKWRDAAGRSVVIQVPIGDFLRRMRIRVVGYDAQNQPAGEDEMVVNDPRPPFRVRVQAPRELPESGSVTLSATVLKPAELAISGVDFFVGEEQVGSVAAPPYVVTIDAAKFPHAVYARVVARAGDGTEANDAAFFGTTPSEAVDVTLQHVPVSVASGGAKPLRLDELTLIDNGQPRKLEALAPAEAEPLYVVLLIDYSESMLDELPVVKAAAKSFAKALLRPQDRIAIVGFNDHIFWLTPFTNDWNNAAAAVDRVKPQSETHLYDSAIGMLYELQKQPGRHALVVLTDGVDQGSHFKLDHLVHYARYAGVPLYPIVKNKMLSRLMRFGVGQLEARRLGSIARDTGATYFIIQKESELPGVYAKLAAELRQQYQLVFYSDPAAGDVWHPLAIENRGGQQLRIPRGYFP